MSKLCILLATRQEFKTVLLTTRKDSGDGSSSKKVGFNCKVVESPSQRNISPIQWISAVPLFGPTASQQ